MAETAPHLGGSRAEAEAWSRLLWDGSRAGAPCLDGSRAEAEAWSRFLFEGYRASLFVMAESIAPRLEGSRAVAQAQAEAWSRAKGKGKGPTWAEAQAMQKRLDSIDDMITDLTWRLNLEKIRGCFGDVFLERIFPTNTSGFSHQSDEELVLMSQCIELVYEFEKRRRLLAYDIEKNRQLAHEPDSKRLRKEEDTDEELSDDDEEFLKPPHIKVMEHELSCLECEYERLYSEQRDPDFSGMTEAERAAEAERLREEAFQKASRLLAAGDIVGALRQQAKACVLDFDPKQDGIYYNNSVTFADLATFDLCEESPIGPMRFTNKVFRGKEIKLKDAVNILSVKVACSDVGFPIQVYGTVIARDCTDYKRVYLFRRDREHCQLINSEDEPLILTGPKRGLLLLDANYVETDLMIKDHQGQDRELSKGVLTIRGIAGRSSEKCEVDTLSLATRLSTVKVAYAYMVSAVEATISIEVEEGEFCGIVTACTTSIKNRLVLYDSQLADHMPGNGRAAIKMMRPVISVFFQDQLVIIARVHGGKTTHFKITPRITKENEVAFTLGTAKMRLRVAWSILDQVAAEQ